MRMFVAVVPPADVVAGIGEFLEPRREADPALRWSASYQWHLTLAFLPEAGSRILDGLIDRLAQAAARHRHLTITLSGSGAFPTVDRAKVLWLGVDPASSQLLGRIATSARSAANTAGADVDGGRFTPHLTLARLRQPRDATRWLRVLDAYDGATWTAGSIELIQSHLGQGQGGHPRYESVAVLPLTRPAQETTESTG